MDFCLPGKTETPQSIYIFLHLAPAMPYISHSLSLFLYLSLSLFLSLSLSIYIPFFLFPLSLTANNNSVRLLKKLQEFGSFNLLRNLPE
jgi:hypothetical protein